MSYVQCSGYYVCKQVTASAFLLIKNMFIQPFLISLKKRDEKSARFVIRSFVNRSQISQFRIAILVGLAESA